MRSLTVAITCNCGGSGTHDAETGLLRNFAIGADWCADDLSGHEVMSPCGLRGEVRGVREAVLLSPIFGPLPWLVREDRVGRLCSDREMGTNRRGFGSGCGTCVTGWVLVPNANDFWEKQAVGGVCCHPILLSMRSNANNLCERGFSCGIHVN